MKTRTRNRLLFTSLIASIIIWPFAYYWRPYPAFGGESLLAVAMIVGYVASKYRESKE